MTDPWNFEHTVHCPVPRDFAWRFWTHVDNWRLDADVVSVQLDGPFAAGAHGTTVSRSSGEISWRLAEVEPGRLAVIEFAAPGAVATFRWTFEDAPDGGTTITQKASINGPSAADYAGFAQGLERGMPDGMQKLCEAIAHARLESSGV